MEIYANVKQNVLINPKDVIQKLIDEEIGYDSWTFEKNDKCFKGFEQSAGCHSYDDEVEITREKYDYIKALQLVLKHLDQS